MIPIETARLTIRQWRADDADAALDIYSRWEVQKFIGLDPRVMADRAEAVAAIERWLSRSDERYGYWAVEALVTGRLLGNVVLKSIPASADTEPLPASGDFEIGWHLHPDVWGNGYATEAAAAVMAHGLDDCGLSRIVAVTHPDNVASQRVALRIGMTDKGRTSQYYNRDCALFERLAD